MILLLIVALIIATAITIGVRRKFGAIQWIWLVFSFVIALLVVWVLVLIFFIGPGMLNNPRPW